jgi:fatty acid desaturase
VEISEYPVPEKLNLIIASGLFVSLIFLLWLGSAIEPIWLWLIGIIYSFLLLTNYALMHEAAHMNLHSDSRINWIVGTLLSCFFPMSFTVFRVTHIVHHCCNRTDHEMFDCYYEGDYKSIKYIQLYGLLTGIWWVLIPVGNLLLAIAPAILRTWLFKRARTTSIIFDDFGNKEVWFIRLEIVLCLLFWITIIQLLGISINVLIVYYICFAFNWSTRQYVTHAFTPRDVKKGALNLLVSRPMEYLFLNGNWDLVHHQHPHVSWIYLKVLGKKSQSPVSYWKQYFRLWRGPVLCTESGPDILTKSKYQGMK